MKRFVALAALAAATALPLSAHAHKLWLQPSATVLSGNDWITVDAAVSNDLFYFNHVPLRLDSLVITAPDGSRLEPANPHTGKLRSVFDLELKQEGTYRLAIVNDGVFASYQLDGERKRWRGRAEALAAELPAGATDVQVSETVGRVETFVTAGAPTTETLAPGGRGLELVPTTHPNDLFAGEEARFALQLDGQPAAGLEVTIVPGGTRYRDAQDEITARTDAQGRFSVTWPEPGMYWLEASTSDDRTSVEQAAQRRVSYVGTFEVLPQ
ncbi:DUF4198 domain-containing protein [Coralloluteibacterium stylophorae]|uniref:DUF4198 domain-containing protein n=1 Tax=Coralloluteibacterium stylophorae TaxID=1776034 RepID=A0A8J8AXW1_9GAMM|nr:DUF4198 domain-containing protein [Coralloluteibacterium stylophorae]MBS7457127.1 DUF4198 domain-containing protein [Coralloluteibacterium stylophorae]